MVLFLPGSPPDALLQWAFFCYPRGRRGLAPPVGPLPATRRSGSGFFGGLLLQCQGDELLHPLVV